eukprot:snap_masked-scaffold_3-processed-gene-17.40-mRNA-1 protein AED:1.00 eAED:1.00 QI:0/0/0/0/1/1/4/0/111
MTVQKFELKAKKSQALGSFIRDESFHQLAFRTNKKVFSNYIKYIDTGVIRKDLIEVLLKQYTRKEREYRKKNIVPELLPEVSDLRFKGFNANRREINFGHSFLLQELSVDF